MSKEIGGYFDCSNCLSLTSLVGVPEEVDGIFFNCSDCENLTSLEGAPKKVGGDFHCENCPKLTSLEGLPKEIGGDLYLDRKWKGKIPKDIIIKGRKRWIE